MYRFHWALIIVITAFGSVAATAQRSVPETAAEMRLSFAPAVQAAAPAVVNVYARRVVTASYRSPFAGHPLFERFFGGDAFGLPNQRVQNSLGSGVILREEGVVVTNHHVVENAQEIAVVLSDRREFPARILMSDERTDLAVLQIEEAPETLAAITLADPDDALVGDLVLAIGNPFGVGQTVTQGVVSALARTQVGVSDYSFFIQTDAAINPGNSGGALIDTQGRLLGVNTAIYSRSGGSIGIGFAIPSNMVERVVASALGEADARRPWLGAVFQSLDPDLAASLRLARPSGALISQLWDDGPLARAGLRKGDVIVAFDGQDTPDRETVRYRVATRSAGDRVEIRYVRGGKERKARAVLALPPEIPERDARRLDGAHPLSGAMVANLSPAVADELDRDPFLTGVVVVGVDPGSFADRFRVDEGDRILAVNGREIAVVADLETALAEGPINRAWTLDVERGGNVSRVRLRI